MPLLTSASLSVTKPSRPSKSLRSFTDQTTKFLVVLDSSVSNVVKRLKKDKNEKEKEDEEEVFVIEGIRFKRNLCMKFDVYINDKDNVIGGTSKTELEGRRVWV
ncbi:hypothetical protein VNO80_25217 [Phaseolus coccineus]|uniref:Polyphenol oxidase C-terminal domain-containing protein n=1 Tax=Phaseolus coccineus TaxID=3886 RepID=A0AAN9LUE9_PHACN